MEDIKSLVHEVMMALVGVVALALQQLLKSRASQGQRIGTLEDAKAAQAQEIAALKQQVTVLSAQLAQFLGGPYRPGAPRVETTLPKDSSP